MGPKEQMKAEGCNPVGANGGVSIESAKHLEVNGKHGKQDDSIPFERSSTISSIASLTSSDSFASTSSDSSIDLNLDGRDDRFDRRAESGQDDPRDRLNGHLRTLSSVIPVDALEKFDISLSNGHNGEKYENLEIKGTVNDSTVWSPDKETEVPYLFDDATDAEIWIPPLAENEDSVSNLDDDDDDEECGDGKWGKPNSLSGFGDEEENSRSFWFKEVKEKALKEVMYGKFRTLVSQLLKTAGIVDLEKGGVSWVDIVTTLAWDAASFVKPDASEAKAMDPAGYVKVKCVATGSRSQSQLIKGLVFKKHAAHKHMPTRYKKPRILLIQGMLGHSSGLSSFNSMIAQDKDNNVQKDSMGRDVKSLLENLDACHPDVVLVEKSAPRDVLEAILKMGVTLVVDMKLHRLQRIARCTGSPILSADIMLSQKLKQCDLLYFEKFVEEHAQVVDGGKKPCKTLMFLVGSPTRLGCTILLKGSHSEELKKIKYVIQCAVVMAYHFILETSFLIDQEAMFSTIVSDGVASTRGKESSEINSSVSHSEEAFASASGDRHNLPVSSGCHEEHLLGSSLTAGSDCSSGSLERNFSLESASANAIDIPISGSSFHESLKVDRPTPIAIPSHGMDITISNGFHEVGNQQLSSRSQYKNVVREVVGTLVSPAEQYMQTFLHLSGRDSEALAAKSYSGSTSDVRKTASDSESCNGRRDDISTVLDSESILVLMSSRNASRGSICEQSHFSHIKFYKNFDVPLGKFLRDNLFNQNVPCKACGQLPEAHFYYYAHHNKQLTIRVKRIPGEKPLPGESEGKLWMWSRCGKCKAEKEGNKNTTKRVLISTAARGLSFGKFLKLSFSNHSSLNRLSNCGHSLHRDFLYFFGSGSMVAMFRYSPVATYCVSVPPQKLEFNGPIKGEWLKKETEIVYTRAMLLFKEVSSYLKKIKSRFSGLTLNLNGSVKEFYDIEKMLGVEKFEFEENIKSTCIKNGESVRKVLCLNRLRWELLLEACIWNRRLQLLPSSSPSASSTSITGNTVQEKPNVDQCADVEVQIEYITGHSESLTEEFQCERQQEVSLITGNNISSSSMENIKDPPNFPMDYASGNESSQSENTCNQVLTERDIPIVEDLGDGNSTAHKSFSDEDASAPASNSENSQGKWIWNPFSIIREKCLIDLHNKGQLLTFQDSLRLNPLHSPDALPTIAQIISEEGSRMHIPLCINDLILSDYEGEISSIIACALSVMKDMPEHTENPSEHTDEAQSVGTDESVSLPRATSHPSPLWSLSSPSLQPDMIHHGPSLSLVESRFSSFDGLNLLDSLVSLGALHPEVHLGMEKYLGKWKYSVVCVYAKEFRGLRKRCCPSELDYISSLSRCKIWDAKGGKSKSFFAKTLDDRLIVKEIKKTEFDSFIKFARAYFHYMDQSFESGNQTCLAKILGIYQVTVRQPKSGKEVKHDLMVMENLSFGRNITRQYDLKGALHARFTANADGSGDVLLDQNFVNDMNASPLYIVQKAKRLLQRAVWNDTTFLNSINVMDYSLLVGVDRERKELVCGIIDYLRQYTWDKQLETWVKSSLVVPKNVLPTVISPREYKKRFRKFMDTHFLTVPDCWRSQRSSSNPCRLCGVGADHPSHPKTDEQEDQSNVACAS